MKKYFANGYNDIYKAIIFMLLVNLTNILTNDLNTNLPLLRYFFAMMGVFYFLKGIFSTRRNIKLLKPSVRNLFYALVLVTIIMIVRGMPAILEGSDHYIHLKLFISGQFLIYIIPFIFFIEPDVYLLRKIFKLCYLLSVAYLFFSILLYKYFIDNTSNSVETFGVLFVAGASIISLTQFYHSAKVRSITLITILIAIFFNIMIARRNQVVYFSSILFFSAIIQLFSSSYFTKNKKATFLLGLVLISIFISGYIYIANNKFIYFYEKTQTGMESRMYVIDKFFTDFDAHPNDYIYGRGINGLVYAGGTSGGNITGERMSIENGYLQHILVGGWIYLGLILLISIGAIYLGFLKSKNLLTKAFAAIVATYLIDMIGMGVPSITLKHLIIWIGIGICYSYKIRNLSDEYLKSIVGLK